MLAFALVAGTVALVKSIFEPTDWWDWRLWGCGVATGTFIYLTILLVMAANRYGTASIVWATVNLALLVPIVLAHFIFHEPLYWVDLGLLLLFLLTLGAFTRDMAPPGGAPMTGAALVFLYLLIGIFFFNGLTAFGGKVKQALFLQENSAAYAALSYFACAALAAGAILRRRERLRITAAEWKVGTLTGLSSVVGLLSVLQAMSLNAVIVFLVPQGLSLLGGVLLTVLIFRERLSACKAAGLALGAAVLVLTPFREQFTVWLTPHLLSVFALR